MYEGENYSDVESGLLQDLDAAHDINSYNLNNMGGYDAHAPSTLEKIRASKLGSKNPNYKGKSQTAESNAKRSKAISGLNNPNYGKEMPLTTKIKLSKKAKGKKLNSLIKLYKVTNNTSYISNTSILFYNTAFSITLKPKSDQVFPRASLNKVESYFKKYRKFFLVICLF